MATDGPPCAQMMAALMAFTSGAAFVLQIIGVSSDEWYNNKTTDEHFGLFRDCPLGESGCKTRTLNSDEEAAAAVSIIALVATGFYFVYSMLHACGRYKQMEQIARVITIFIATGGSIGAWTIMTIEHEAHKDESHFEVRSGSILYGIGAFLTALLLFGEAIMSCHLGTNNSYAPVVLIQREGGM